MNREETLLSTAQAAERLGVTVRGVQKMIEEGRLKALKIGRDYVISPHALEGITRQPAGRPPKVKAEVSPTGEKPKRATKKVGKK
jgi:excisionase family DNA binding protein